MSYPVYTMNHRALDARIQVGKSDERGNGSIMRQLVIRNRISILQSGVGSEDRQDAERCQNKVVYSVNWFISS